MDAKPRVLADGLSKRIDQYVTILGPVKNVGDETANVDASGDILVHLIPTVSIKEGGVYEIIAKVVSDKEVKALSSDPMPSPFPARLAERVVRARDDNPDLFD